MECQGIEPGGLGGPDRQQSDPVLAGELRPGGRSHGGDRDIEEGAGVRAEVQPRIAKIPPVVLEGDRLVATQQAHDDVGPLREQLACLALVEGDHGRIGRQ